MYSILYLSRVGSALALIHSMPEPPAPGWPRLSRTAARFGLTPVRATSASANSVFFSISMRTDLSAGREASQVMLVSGDSRMSRRGLHSMRVWVCLLRARPAECPPDSGSDRCGRVQAYRSRRTAQAKAPDASIATRRQWARPTRHSSAGRPVLAQAASADASVENRPMRTR